MITVHFILFIYSVLLFEREAVAGTKYLGTTTLPKARARPKASFISLSPCFTNHFISARSCASVYKAPGIDN